MMMRAFGHVLAFCAAMLTPTTLTAQEWITLSSTTSVENSGLFDHVLPIFTRDTGIEVRVVTQGTGQALETARRGDADVVLVHARELEEQFVAEGYGVARHDVMSNEFVIIGPATDPANLREARTAAEAMRSIAQARLRFVSRGDDSGTHIAEQRLWAEAGIVPVGRQYLSTGSGMGAALNIAVQLDAHVLSDRGTWLSFANRGDHDILFEGDPALFNPYGIILVNPDRHPHVRAAEGRVFIDWMLSPAGQEAIGGFRIGPSRPFIPVRREAR